MATKLKASVFIEAAQLIDNDIKHYACNAIVEVCNLVKIDNTEYINLFNIFKPTLEEYYNIHNCRRSVFISDKTIYTWWPYEDKESRILAMLLCAEMIKNS